MKFIISLIFSLTTFWVSSQLTIVKDNLGCGYGLMSTEGKWVVQPDYTLIETLGGSYFTMLNENGRGLINLEGKEIIRPKYDWIAVLNDSLFSIRQKQFYGIYHLRNGEIIPPIHFQLIYQHPFFISSGTTDSKNAIYNRNGEKITKIAYDYSHISIDQILLYTRKEEQFFTTRIDLDGIILQPEMKGYYLPFNEFGLAPIGDVGSYSRVNGKAGIINKEGKVIAERKYQSIQYCNDKFILLDSNSTAFMDADGSDFKEWSCQFWPLESNSYTHVPECLFNDYTWQSRCKDKVGLFSGLGNHLAEPIYDAIQPFPYSQRTQSCSYKAYQQGNCGILNMQGKETIPPQYDELEVPEINAHIPEDYSSHLTLLLAKKNNKFGLINELNQVVVPIEYEKFVFNGGYYFFNNNEVSKIEFNDTITISKGKRLFILDSLEVVQFDNNQLDAFVVGNANRTIVDIQSIGVLKRLNYYNSMNSQITYLISADNKKKTRIQYMEPYQNLAKVHTFSGKVGVLNYKTGKFILDTLYCDISLHFEEYNLVWVMKSQGEKWMVFDTNGVKKSPIQFEQIHLFTEPVIARNNNKVGIVNTDLRWLLKPKFLGINRISDSLYLVQTSSKKFGVFHPNKGWIMDTIFTNFEYVFNHYLNNWKSKSSISKFGTHPVNDYWLLANKKQKLLFDQKGNTYVAGTEEFDSLRYHSAFTKTERSYVYFTIKLSENSWVDLLKMPYAKELYQKLNKRYEKNKPCPFSVSELSTDISCTPNSKRSSNPFGIYATIQLVENKKTRKLETIKKEDSIAYYKIPIQEKYSIAFAGKKCVSVSIDFHDPNPTYSPYYYGGMPYQDYPNSVDEVKEIPDSIFNFFWNGQALQKVNREQLFPSDSLLIEFLKMAIQNRRDLNLNCNSPTFYTDLIKNEFHISPSGSVFYVGNSRGWFNQLLIPKEIILKQEGISVQFSELFN
jgi:hypothetical protein